MFAEKTTNIHAHLHQYRPKRQHRLQIGRTDPPHRCHPHRPGIQRGNHFVGHLLAQRGISSPTSIPYGHHLDRCHFHQLLPPDFRIPAQWQKSRQNDMPDKGSPDRRAKTLLWDCLLRWSLRLIDTTAMGIVAISSIVISSRMQRLGDLAAGTVVILEKNGVPLREISLYDTPDDYQVVFPQVSMLTDKDIAIIKEVMHEVEQQREYQLLVPLASRVRTLTGIQTRMDNLAFMQTVLKDYVHLTKK